MAEPYRWMNRDEQYDRPARANESRHNAAEPGGPADVAAGWHGSNWYAPRDYGAQAKWGGQTGAREWSGPRAGRAGYGPESYDDRFGARSLADRYSGYEGPQGDYLGGHGYSGIAPQGAVERRGPKGYRRSDERIGEDLYIWLVEASFLDPSEVMFEVKEGRVTLDGTVPERRMKHAIEDIVAACPGVTEVENRIRVLPLDTARYR